MDIKLNKEKKITLIVLVVLALVSAFFLSKVFSSVAFHQASIQFLDDKKLTVAGLSAGLTGFATLIAAIPGDTTTPLANQLASGSTWLLAITCVIIVEKYLITLIGFISFAYIIPAACVIYIVYLFVNKQFLKELAIKLGIFGLAIFLIIPTSVQITRVIETAHEETVALTDAQQIQEDLQKDLTAVGEDKNFLEQTVDLFTGAGQEVLEVAKTAISKFVDAIAILFVTSCLIPILVLFVFSWLLKMVFNMNITVPKKLTQPFHKKEDEVGQNNASI